MRCGTSEELMGWRLAGRLDGAQRAAHDAHLAECAACAARWRAQCRVDAALAGRPDDHQAVLPPDLKDRVLARITTEQPRPAAPVRPFGWALAIGLATLLLPVWFLALAVALVFLDNAAVPVGGRTEAAMVSSRGVQLGGTLGGALLTVDRWFLAALVSGSAIGFVVTLALGLVLWLLLLRRWGRGVGPGRPA